MHIVARPTYAFALLAFAVVGCRAPQDSAPAQAAREEVPGHTGFNGIALSPDGMSIVLGEPSGVGLRRHFVGQPGATQIPGTGGASVYAPMVSPDGNEVAFHRSGRIEVVSLDAGGEARTVAPGFCCPIWGPDGFLYFTGPDRTIQRVPGGGGAVEGVTELGEGDTQHWDFQLLPGNDAALVSVQRVDGTSRIESIDLATGERDVLAEGATPRLMAEEYLLFADLEDGSLMAARLDLEAAELISEPTAVIEGLSVAATGVVNYDVSETGTLAYLTGAPGDSARFVWVTRTGEASPISSASSAFAPGNGGSQGWQLSPNGDQITFGYVGRVADYGIWVESIATGSRTELVSRSEVAWRPFWSSDGEWVSYLSGPSPADRNVWRVRADGSGEPELVLDHELSFTQAVWSPDGEWLAARIPATAAMGFGGRDIVAVDVAAGTVVPIATTDAREESPTLSPDGAWVAYSSDETGASEIYIRRFPDVDVEPVRVSTNGGRLAIWGHSGEELFIVDDDRTMTAVEFDPQTGQVGLTEQIFTLPSDIIELSPGNYYFDISADDQRFLMARRLGVVAPRVVVVEDFLDELEERIMR